MKDNSSSPLTEHGSDANPSRPSRLLWMILLATLVSPPLAHSNTLFLADCNFGFHSPTYFSNEIVCVSGTADTKIDGLFPSADVYVTENRSWTSGDSLAFWM